VGRGGGESERREREGEGRREGEEREREEGRERERGLPPNDLRDDIASSPSLLSPSTLPYDCQPFEYR
jgi:hypothetical protein